MNRFELLLITVLSASAAMAETGTLPKPPALTAETHPESVLQTYPLGVITEQAAFAAHGGPDKKITLPNGKPGWVYAVGYAKNRETYRLPSGQTRTADETAWELGVRNFTLQRASPCTTRKSRSTPNRPKAKRRAWDCGRRSTGPTSAGRAAASRPKSRWPRRRNCGPLNRILPANC